MGRLLVLLMNTIQIEREGTRKTLLRNFTDACQLMSRDPNHVMLCILPELGAFGSIVNSNLLIRGRFQPKQIESVIKHYIRDYTLYE